MPRTPPGRAAVSIALVTFAIVFAGLAIFSYTRQSATFGVKRINLATLGAADPSYYGMNVRYTWGTIMPEVSPAAQTAPDLPGYVAVSATLLDGVPFEADKRDFYKPLRDSQPAADIGGSIKVYWVERPWW